MTNDNRQNINATPNLEQSPAAHYTPIVKVICDLVLVLDVTGAMSQMTYTLLSELERLRQITDCFMCPRESFSLNARVVAFRDFMYNYPEYPPLEQCPFFDIMQDEGLDQLRHFLKHLEVGGGEDVPESGLEALHIALHSDWTPRPANTPCRRRQIIILITDAPAKDIWNPFFRELPYYPQDMPTDLIELETEYCNNDVIDQCAKRLVIFAPLHTLYEHNDLMPCIAWEELSMWDNCVSTSIEYNGGGYDFTMDRLLEILSACM